MLDVCDEVTCLDAFRLRFAGPHEVVIHDMNKPDIASKAKQYGVRSVPAVVIDGKLASCCASRGPEESVLKAAFA